MGKERQYVEFAIQQLVAVFATELNAVAPKHVKLASCLTHTDYTLTALDTLLSQNHPRPLLNEGAIWQLKSLIANSLSQAIATRTNVMMSADKTGRRYKLQETLIKSILLEVQLARLVIAAELATEQQQPLVVYKNGQLALIAPPANTVSSMVSYVKQHITLHPYSNAVFEI